MCFWNESFSFSLLFYFFLQNLICIEFFHIEKKTKNVCISCDVYAVNTDTNNVFIIIFINLASCLACTKKRKTRAYKNIVIVVLLPRAITTTCRWNSWKKQQQIMYVARTTILFAKIYSYLHQTLRAVNNQKRINEKRWKL